MGTSYQATMNVQCLKEHTCVCCTGKFSYLLTREIKAEGATQAKALENAQGMAISSMENDVDFHPCPICGIVQPEMTAEKKKGYYGIAILIAIVVLIVAFICGMAQGMRISTSAITALIGIGVSMLLFIRGVLYNPNSNPQLNIANAQSSIESKQLIVTEPVQPGQVEDTYGGIKTGNIAGLIFSGLAILAVAAPTLLAMMNGWHKNDTTYPAVSGPGDKTTIYFTGSKEIKSLKSYWSGRVSAQIKNFGELGLPNGSLSGKTKEDNWGNKISGKSLSNNTNTMWAQVEIPDGSDLNGKTANIDLKVDASYPFEVPGGFVIDSDVFNHSTKVTFSGAKAGSTYYSSWLYGQIGACVLLLISAGCHFSTCNWLKAQGNPTTVTTLGDAGDEEFEGEGDASEAADPGAGPEQAGLPEQPAPDSNPYLNQ